MIGKHSLPGALGVQCAAIKKQPHGRSRIRSGQNIQLLLCPIKLAGKQKKLKQERTALDVEWIGPQLVAKRRDGFPQLAFAVKRKWRHCSSGDFAGLEVVTHRPCSCKNALLILCAVLDLDCVVAERNALGRILT